MTDAEIISRLATFGYNYDSTKDADTLTFCKGFVEKDIYNFCNVTAVPTDANYIAIDMVCCKFFSTLTVGIGLSDGIYAGLMNKVELGDTAVQLGDATSGSIPNSTFFTTWYRNMLKKLITFRKVRW